MHDGTNDRAKGRVRKRDKECGTKQVGEQEKEKKGTVEGRRSKGRRRRREDMGMGAKENKCKSEDRKGRKKRTKGLIPQPFLKLRAPGNVPFPSSFHPAVAHSPYSFLSHSLAIDSSTG